MNQRGKRRVFGAAMVAAAGLATSTIWIDKPLGQTSPAGQAAALCVSRPGDTPTGTTAPPASAAGWAEGARLFDGLGDFHRPVTTKSEEAQAWFDQGMRYLWAFNHDESTRSFAKAAQIDPDCAMCWWGVALTVGPNYNLPMMAEPRAKVAWEALQQAARAAPKASPVERALIDALRHRYNGTEALDPAAEAPLLTAYAAAMERVATRFPNDPDVRVIAAEAMMTANAWKLWTLDGKPAPGTLKILAQLEAALAAQPMHPGANHYYIHAIEASPAPEKAVPSARRLDGLMPAAGHLVHMPAHIWQRVGQYEKAADANRRAIAADSAYYKLTQPLDYYAMYTAHNIQFLAFATAMEGRKAETVQTARDAQSAISDDMMLAMPGVDWYQVELYGALIRFGLWDEMLAEAAPNPKLRAMTGGFLYARATALAAKGRADEARPLLVDLERMGNSLAPDDGAGLNSARDVLALAAIVLKARLSTEAGQDADSIRLLREAAAKEDQLAYDEPADWFIPVRQQLGVALLKAGQAKEAEAVYREDLRRHPANGWSLFGLTQALKTQGRTRDAAAYQAEFDKAWSKADVTLTSSAF
jgi:tetratricopeptide (TPR) repeat protein